MMAHGKITNDADLKAFIGKTLMVQQRLGMAQKGNNMKVQPRISTDFTDFVNGCLSLLHQEYSETTRPLRGVALLF